MKHSDVLIIGAGLCGLLLSRKLRKSFVILEKSKGVGGRIANRRIQDLGFDHGAPYLKNDEAIKNLLSEEGIKFHVSDKGIYIDSSMTRLPKALAANLQIEKGVRAENLRHDGKKWIITTDTAGDFTSDSIVITAPLPQTLELLTKSQLPYNPDLNSIHYSKAVMALVITKDGMAPDSIVPEGIHSLLPMSERHLHPRGFVIRASEEISNQMFDTNSDEEILSFLVNQFKKSFLKAPEIEYSELKKWRYVLPMKALPDPYLEVHKNLFITGDSFVYNDVRGALHGAHALAEKLNSLS